MNNIIDITRVIEAASNVADSTNIITQAAEVTNAAQGTSNLGKFIGVGIVMLAAMGTGVVEGLTAMAAATAVGRNPEAQPKIMNTMIVGMAITESVAIYALIVSILLIFVA